MHIERRLGPGLGCAALAALVLAGCGGGKAVAPPPEGPSDPEVAEVAAVDKDSLCREVMAQVREDNDTAWELVLEAGPPSTLEEMAGAACQAYCARATECAIDDACAQLSGEEIADLKLDQTAPENTRRCLEACHSWKLSKAQIRIIGECSQVRSDCPTFRTCTEQAQAR